jgi:ATP-dependent RNA helicase DDX55/SPB4
MQSNTIETKDWSEAIEGVVLQDREVYEEAQKAFVSYIRFYQEQELSFLFRMKDLDVGDLAHSYSLLRLPRVTEILGKTIATFTPSDKNPDDIAFKDHMKEAKRQEELVQKAAIREERRLAKLNAREQNMRRTRSEKRVAKRSTFAKELDSLRHEENLVKKIKRGKVSSEEAQKFLAEFPNLKAIFRRKRH